VTVRKLVKGRQGEKSQEASLRVSRLENAVCQVGPASIEKVATPG